MGSLAGNRTNAELEAEIAQAHRAQTRNRIIAWTIGLGLTAGAIGGFLYLTRPLWQHG